MASAKHVLHRDFETRSTVRLELAGAWRYAADSTTEVLCVGYAIDDGPVQIWTPGEPVPPEFVEAARKPDWLVAAHNDQFESAIEERLLAARYGFPLIPQAQHRCTMAMALAAALPGSLEGAAETRGLPYQKDRYGQRLMRRLARRTDKDPDPDELQHLYAYCRQDVEVERALYQQLPALSDDEQALWVLDAIINRRGFHVHRALAVAARELARKEQEEINAAVTRVTGGTITTANQVARIQAFVAARGHALTKLTKHAVSAVLAGNPSAEVKELLELRRDGSRASVRKLNTLLAGLDHDDRLRGTLRFHGAATGRWSGSRFQPHNLKRPQIQDLDTAIEAIIASDMDRVRNLGAPMSVIGDVSRAMICAAPGHVLMGADFSAIESRVLAWIAGEHSKLEIYRSFDASGDAALEPYCVTASQVLKRAVTPADEAGRTIGKTCDLAFGYGGGLGAWRKFDSSDLHSDDDVERFKCEWRNAHRKTVVFWRALETAMRRAIRSGQSITLRSLSCRVENGTLYVTLPSGRRLAYPHVRLVPGELEGTTQIVFNDNARGAWREIHGWYGTFTENVVQAIARDLLAAAMFRLEAAGYPVVLHVHDEIACEVPIGFGSANEFKALMTILPTWADGLPVIAKLWNGPRYRKTSAQPITSEISAPIVIDTAAPEPAAEIPSEAVEPQVDLPSLADLIGEPLRNGKICCPFHDDRTPSLQVYDDHFHCFGCGAHGDRMDWLMIVEGHTREQALELLQNRQTRTVAQPRQSDDSEAKRALALRLWQAAKPIAGTLATQYLAEHRCIDLAGLPADVDDILRFHPHCPFGQGVRHPCLLALLRNVASDEPTGIQRIALKPDASKIERRMLGTWGAVKLWPVNGQLIVGEGIETVLAAATRLSHKGNPLRPAWSALSRIGFNKLPIIAGVHQLVLLVDNDLNGQGQAAAARCAERWSRAGRHVIQLKPKRPGTDFNDIVMERAP
jgi:DNA polymerase